MTSRPSGWSMELVCAYESLRVARRHRRYLVIWLALYAHSARGWSQARAARFGYAFLQLFDDIMDGDRATRTPREIVAQRIIWEWERARFGGEDALSQLGATLHDALRALPLAPADDPFEDVLVLLRAMRGDAERVATGGVLTADEVESMLRTTFHHSLNVLLIAAGVRTRAADVPDLVACMGWCSVVRDLDEDLRRGLINIPADVVARVRAGGANLTPHHPEVRLWLADARRAVLPRIDASAATLREIARADPGAARLLGLFQRSAERYAGMSTRSNFER